MMPLCHSVPVLRVEEWPLPGDSLTNSTVRALIDKLNRCAQGGWRFVGSVLQQAGDGSHGCSGYMPPAQAPSEYRDREKTSYSRDLRLLVLFHSWAPCCPPLDPAFYCYHHGALSMRVSRKGHVLSALEADWLEMTAMYYRKGWSLVDSFVYWDTPKGEPVPRSLEGLFVYEECSTAPPSNDAVVVEQWTVVEGSNVKTDYGPLLYTLAEFGWLLTCVLPTPIIRHDSEGNLATKQVLFLQRPISTQAVVPQQKQSCRKMISSSTGVRVHADEMALCTGRVQETSAFEEDYSSTLSQLENSCFEQDDSASEVTCM
ncbi:raftlin-2-like [Scleropages formosus]|uniref:Raftlin-2-like n=1 Tax=Scleropages formosus TaxID=113540 RepID=A0A0P7YBM9_SCLFO|nr:raftlin-2-like [Scleropages formosus]